MIYWPDSWNHQKRNKGRFVWTWTAWIELKSVDFIAGTTWWKSEVSWSTSSLDSQNKTHLTGCLNTSFRWKMCEENKCQSWMTVFCHLRPRLRLQIVQTGNRRQSQVSLGRGQKVFVAETWKRHFLKTLPNILTSRKTFTLFLLEGNGQTSEKNVKVGCDGTQTGTCDHFLQ